MTFTRLGALVEHSKPGVCRAFPQVNIEAIRKEKEYANTQARRARNFNDFSRVGLSFGEEQHPLAWNI